MYKNVDVNPTIEITMYMWDKSHIKHAWIWMNMNDMAVWKYYIDRFNEKNKPKGMRRQIGPKPKRRSEKSQEKSDSVLAHWSVYTQFIKTSIISD